MDKLIQLSSVTEAMRARDILKKHSINSVVQRIPPTKGQGVCSYGVRVFRNIEKAAEILAEHNIGRASGANL